MDPRRIRNFCIIAHIDHGKSTLADRFLEETGTIARRDMAEQVLDAMDLEREKGVTIKAKAVRMAFAAKDGIEYELNLIDTPGHVDFGYEVSRALAACEGALLVVDAAQGIQAQTLANVYLALDADLKLIPVVNKIDLPSAEPERVAQELVDSLGFSPDEILFASAKEGTGTHEILEAVVERIPPPPADGERPLRALIFDSKYDAYKGVIAYVRVMDGMVSGRRKLRLMSTRLAVEPLEVGVFRPGFEPVGQLTTGEVGYVATGLKNVKECRVGDTFTDDRTPAAEALPGYRPAKPMVFAGLYPSQANEYGLLRDALDKLQLNDASLVYEPESSGALGFGFRCGFLGLLHMEIVQERLEREYGLNLLATAPSVEYQVTKTDGTEIVVDNPAELPPPNEIAEIREPWMDISIVVPDRYIGAVMELVTGNRGEFRRMEYLQHGVIQDDGTKKGEGRVVLEYRIPLSEILVDFYDQLKSRTQGYASLDYSFFDYLPAQLVKLDILVNGEPVDALSLITHRGEAASQGRQLVEKLRSLIPRQMFDVPVQAAIGGRIVARETIRAMRKNVLAKCYGGDVTRKRKLLEKQAEGKKRMKRVGNVDIPQEAFMAVLRLDK
ncbi:MAG TPA: translation elongation factor 4 [Dehalococcoidia bacterium]|jgi:GTP-binding protein LepA|nr:translation elongation factor 4 [Dehalococcoidia bacterium]